MLDVWSTSGNKVTSISVEELTDVRELKKQLTEVCGVTRFRQRLLHEQKALEDEFRLDALDPPFDLHLVVLPFSDVSDDEAIELREAASDGRLGRVEEILQRPQHPDSFMANRDFMINLGRFQDRRVRKLAKQTPLFWAFYRKNTEIACRLLEAEADVHKVCKEPVTLLCWACYNGEVETSQLLLKAGITSDADDGTLLTLASHEGQAGIVGLLLEAGAGINKAARPRLTNRALRHDTRKAIKGMTPLAIACDKAHIEIVDLLLLATADANQASARGTPLALSASKGCIEIVHLLLEFGADSSARGHVDSNVDSLEDLYDCEVSMCHATPLALASRRGDAAIAQLLLQSGADPADDGEPLTGASGNGHMEVVRLLLEARASVNAFGDYGHAPLGAAARNGHWQIVKVLMEAGAAANQAAGHDTPLGLACGCGHLEIARLLLQSHADKDKVEPDGITPLAMAARGGSIDTALLLLDAGADKEKVGRAQGFTPLWLASREGHVEIVQLLLDARSSTEKVCGPQNATPLWVACRERHESIQLLLRSACTSASDIDTATHNHIAPMLAATATSVCAKRPRYS